MLTAQQIEMRRERWRRWKARDREPRGAFFVDVELDRLLLERMLDLGLIAERDSRSRKKVGRAIRNFLTNAFGYSGPDAMQDAARIDDARREEDGSDA